MHTAVTQTKETIMELRYRHYMALTAAQLEDALTLRKLTDAQRKEIKRVVAEQKANAKSYNAKRRVCDELWSELLAPARRERKVVGVLLNTAKRKAFYEDVETGPSAPRIKALQAYADSIDKFLGVAKRLAETLESPYRIAKRPTSKRPMGVPNNGTHWTDWVLESEKKEIRAMFAAIPKGVRHRGKTPYERTIPKLFRVNEYGEKLSVFETTRMRLRKQTEGFLKQAEREQALLDNMGGLAAQDTEYEALKHKVKQLRQAVHLIDTASDDTPLPTSWRGFFAGEE
jgi:hypothetical protein